MAGVEVDLEPLAADAMPRRGLARKADGTPTAKTQRNFTDSDSHLTQSSGTFLQGYNSQVAVDSDHQVIVAVGVSNQASDVEHLEPMQHRIGAIAGALPDVLTIDAGYWSEDNANACADQGIDSYIATGRLPHGKPPPPKRGPLLKDAYEKIRMARKLRSKRRSPNYAAGTNNLLKLWRFRRSHQQGLVAATACVRKSPAWLRQTDVHQSDGDLPRRLCQQRSQNLGPGGLCATNS